MTQEKTEYSFNPMIIPEKHTTEEEITIVYLANVQKFSDYSSYFFPLYGFQRELIQLTHKKYLL